MSKPRLKQFGALSPSVALGVGHLLRCQITASSFSGAAPLRISPSNISSWFAPLWSRVWGVGLADAPDPEDEDPLALVAKAHAFRAEKSALNRVTQAV